MRPVKHIILKMEQRLWDVCHISCWKTQLQDTDDFGSILNIGGEHELLMEIDDEHTYHYDV